MRSTLTLPTPLWPGLHIRYGFPTIDTALREVDASPNERAYARRDVLESAIEAVLADESDELVDLGEALGCGRDLGFLDAAQALGVDAQTEHEAITALLGDPGVFAHARELSRWMKSEMGC